MLRGGLEGSLTSEVGASYNQWSKVIDRFFTISVARMFSSAIGCFSSRFSQGGASTGICSN